MSLDEKIFKVKNNALSYDLRLDVTDVKKFIKELIEDIKKDFKIIFKSELNKSQAIEKLSIEPPNEHRNLLLNFLEKSKRGLCIASGLKDRA